MSRRVGGAGFQPGGAVVKADQAVGVDKLGFPAAQAVHPDGGEGDNLLAVAHHQLPRQRRHILRAGVVAVLVKAGAVDIVGVDKPQLLRLVVHALHKGLLGGGQSLGKDDRRIVGAGDNQRLEQVLHRHLLALFEPNLRPAHRLGVGRAGEGLIHGERPILQRLEDEQQVHQLGQRRRSQRLPGVLLKEQLAGLLLDQQDGFCGEAHRDLALFLLGEGGDAARGQQAEGQGQRAEPQAHLSDFFHTGSLLKKGFFAMYMGEGRGL